jgi:hypothetical protein
MGGAMPVFQLFAPPKRAIGRSSGMRWPRCAGPSILISLMRRFAAISLVLAVYWAQAAPRVFSWNKIRYRGGTVQAKVNPFDWNTTLTIQPDLIILLFNPNVTVRIKPSQVTSLSYGQEAYRHVADVVALSAVLSPLALFGLLHVSKDHLVGIVYHTDDGKPAAVLLEVHKGNYRRILLELKESTGKPVENMP